MVSNLYVSMENIDNLILKIFDASPEKPQEINDVNNEKAHCSKLC